MEYSNRDPQLWPPKSVGFYTDHPRTIPHWHNAFSREELDVIYSICDSKTPSSHQEIIRRLASEAHRLANILSSRPGIRVDSRGRDWVTGVKL
jgi:hypothetical protein